MTLLSIDFETYFDTKLSLTKMTTMEYVRHPDFKVWGVGIRHVGDNTATWYGEDEAEDYIHSIPWEDTQIIAHNAMFDAYILTQYYGVTPAYYYDTAAMARGVWPGQSARFADVAQRVFPDYNDMADNKAFLESIARSFGYFFGRDKKVRVNTISQSPTPTTAGKGVKGFDGFIAYAEKMSPLGNATAADCADYTISLFSDLTKKVTLQNLFHDGGFSNMGVSDAVMKKFE